MKNVLALDVQLYPFFFIMELPLYFTVDHDHELRSCETKIMGHIMRFVNKIIIGP